MLFKIKPKGESKRKFLERVGERVSPSISWDEIFEENELPVVMFSGFLTWNARIMTCASDLEDWFVEPEDRRIDKLFLVPVSELLKVSPEFKMHHYLETLEEFKKMVGGFDFVNGRPFSRAEEDTHN